MNTRHRIALAAFTLSALMPFVSLETISPAGAYSEASSEASSEAGSEATRWVGGRRRGRRAYYRQMAQQERRQEMQQQRMQQQQFTQRQKTGNQSTTAHAPHVVIHSYGKNRARNNQAQTNVQNQ
jgi:hypothetical protein